MKNAGKVSIIVPVYNAEKYLRESISSILEQSYTNLEIITINDGSTDLSSEILKEYREKDKRIVIFDQKNRGVSAARNVGLDNASGDFIMFVDADDVICPDMVEILLDGISEKIDMSICNMAILSDHGDTNQVTNMRKKLNCREYVFELQSNWGPYCKLFKKEILEGIRFTEGVAIAEDLLFNVMIISKNRLKYISYIEDNLYLYRVNKNSATAAEYSEKYYIGLLAEKKAFKYLVESGYKKEVYKIIFNGILVMYSRLAELKYVERKRYKNQYKASRRIIAQHRYYLSRIDTRRNFIDQLKMYMIIYCVYGFFLLHMLIR